MSGWCCGSKAEIGVEIMAVDEFEFENVKVLSSRQDERRGSWSRRILLSELLGSM